MDTSNLLSPHYLTNRSEPAHLTKSPIQQSGLTVPIVMPAAKHAVFYPR